MKKSTNTLVIAGLIVLASSTGFAETQIRDGKQASVIQSDAPLSTTDDAWHVSITPYMWIPSVDLDVSVPLSINGKQYTANLSVDQPWWNTVSDLFKGKTSVLCADGRIEVSKGRWGAFVDGYWLYTKVSQDGSSSRTILNGDATITRTNSITNQTQIMQINFGPRYLLGTIVLDKAADVSVGFEAYGGARVNWFSNSLEATATINNFDLRFGKGINRTFIEPMIGLKTVWKLGPNFVAILRGDIGGWGVVEDNVDCDLEAAIAWQFHKNTYIDIGYRARGQWMNVGASNSITVQGWAHGPELGMTFCF